MLRIAAHLPDPLVRLRCVRDRVVDQSGDAVPHGRRYRAPAVRVCDEGVEQHAPHVVLLLVVGAVTCAHRTRVQVAREVVEGVLGEVGLTPDPVHDLQVPSVVAGRRGHGFEHEREVLERLPVEAECVQGAEHERAVADPGEAVVPIPLTARRLRQRRRARGHDRARRRVAQALQRQRATFDVRTPGMVGDSRQAQPPAPEVLRLAELLERLVLARRDWTTPRQRDPCRVALGERGTPVRAGSNGPQPQAARQLEREITTRRRDSVVPGVVVRPGPGGSAVVEHRQAVGLHLDVAAEARRDPQQRSLRGGVARHSSPRCSSFGIVRGAHHQHIVHRHPAGRCVPSGLQHVGAGHVPALIGDARVRRTEPEHPGRAIEQRPEHARRVRPRQAQPLDRAVGCDQRADLAVGHEAIAGNGRELAHRSPPPGADDVSPVARHLSVPLRAGILADVIVIRKG